MKLGTIAYKNKIYNLNYIDSEDLKELINKMELDKKREIESLAMLNWIYTQKISTEAINTKVNNQLNSMKMSIETINSKFVLKSKNYEKIESLLKETLNKYEQNLNKICNIYDSKINQLILKKVENEFLTKKEENEEEKLKLQKEVKKLTKKINDLNEQKIKKVFSAMETENTAISTQIKKVRTFKSIKKFFVNKFNTYNTIIKNVINPVNQRIENFKENQLKKYSSENKKLNFGQFKQKIELIKKQISKK